MNKQAITFLSLFSLILVLSVYYVMLPPSVNNEDKVEIVSTDTQNFSFTQMELELSNRRDEELKENNDIIADSASSSQQVNEALLSIQNIKDISALEDELKTHLVDNGYENVFVEIDGTTIKVTIALADAQTQDATTVINLVLDKVDNQYVPEVKFVSE